MEKAAKKARDGKAADAEQEVATSQLRGRDLQLLKEMQDNVSAVKLEEHKVLKEKLKREAEQAAGKFDFYE